MRRLHRRRPSPARLVAGRVLAVGTLGLAAVPLAGLFGGGPATALAPTASSYWAKFGAAMPTVPKGGLLVGADPGSDLTPASPVGGSLPTPVTTPAGVPQSDVVGPTAISAVRIKDVSPTEPATLSLTVASGSAPSPAVSVILACPLAADWSPPASEPGDMSKAPVYNCTSSSSGKVASDNSSISWLLPSSFQSTQGELDVALVPDPAGTVPFEVAFNPPGMDAVSAASGAPAEPAPDAAAATADTTPAAAPDTTPAAAPADLGPAPVFSDTGAGLSVPAAPSAAPASRPAAPTFNPIAPIAARLPGDDRAHRIMAVAVLVLIAAGWWYVGGRPARGPRLLGALAADASPVAVRQAGIGRFSRPRTGPAPRLQ